MLTITLAIAAGTMLTMAVVFSYILGWANKKFKVEADPKIETVLAALPGANCGGCGYLGCSDYAVAIVTDNDPVNKCTVGGEACARQVASIMGVEAGDLAKIFAIVHCGAGTPDRLKPTEYRGEQRCTAAHQVAGLQGCAFGCLGLGDCTRVCNYNAVHIKDGLATVDYRACVGCGACAKVCPRQIISITDFMADHIPTVACSNKDNGKEAKTVCNKSCIGCRVCTKHSELFAVTDNLSKCDHKKYSRNDLEQALISIEKCPTNCIHMVGEPE